MKCVSGLLLVCWMGPLWAEADRFRNDYRPEYTDTIAVSELMSLQNQSDFVLLDVRLKEDFDQNPVLISGAQYRNPELVGQWLSTIDGDQEVVVYCVAGKWVSQKIAYLLHEAGVSVRSLEGGLNAWIAQQN